MCLGATDRMVAPGAGVDVSRMVADGTDSTRDAGPSLSPRRPSRRRLPVAMFQGLLPIDRGRVPAEMLAGATLAALAIPEVMGYASIAGMPAITGLYTMLVPLVLFAVLGSSRHLVVGADSATAAIMAAALTGMAATGSSEYVALAGVLALLAGAYLLLARVLRLGFLADFLSRTVLIGFLTGVGVQVAAGQFSGLFGVAKNGKRPVAQVINAFGDFEGFSLATLAVSAAVLGLIIVGGRLLKKVPWALIAVIGAISASAVFSLSSHGVETLGAIPKGLPGLSIPRIAAGDWATLAGVAAWMLVVILAQSAATSRAYAAKFNDDFDENVDLVGLGFANLGAGLSGTFVVNGSPTKTAMVDDAGGRSQLAQLTTGLIVAIALLFFTNALSYLPDAVLSAVVFLIGVQLVDVKGMRRILQRRPVEFAVALATAATVVLLGVEQGILLAIVLSMIAHLRHSYRPNDRLLFPTVAGDWRSGPLSTGIQAAPGLVVYRFGASLYYANAGRFAEEVRALVDQAPVPARWFCLAAGIVEDLDYSGSAVLKAVVTGLDERGVTFVMCDVHASVFVELKRDGLLDAIGEGNVFASVGDVLEAYNDRHPPGAAADTRAGDPPE